jgi:hypothetical protein
MRAPRSPLGVFDVAREREREQPLDLHAAQVGRHGRGCFDGTAVCSLRCPLSPRLVGCYASSRRVMKSRESVKGVGSTFPRFHFRVEVFRPPFLSKLITVLSIKLSLPVSYEVDRSLSDTPTTSPHAHTMAEEEPAAEAPTTGTFIFPSGPDDKYDGEWKAKELAEGEEPPPEPEKDENGEIIGEVPRNYLRHGKGKSVMAGKWTYEGDWGGGLLTRCMQL